jgi:hypothetical protein
LKRLSLPRVLASIISSIALSFSFLTLYSNSADAEGELVEAPESINVSAGGEPVQLGTDFQLSGFSDLAQLRVSISLLGDNESKISIVETQNLELQPGYESWSDVDQINFVGTMGDINSAIDSILFSPGSQEAEISLKIEVSENIENTAFFDGHLYEFVPGQFTYMEAREQALLREVGGVSGYLVTITSEEEHLFVLSKIENAENIWIALSDRENEGEWVLDSGVEPEQGTTIWSGLGDGYAAEGAYADWCPYEPNDVGGEDAAVTKWEGGDCWNDLPHADYPYVGGYVAEYELEANQVFSATMRIFISGDESPPNSTSPPSGGVTPIPNSGFETNSFDGWDKGSQSSALGPSINGNGTGVTIFYGPRTFTHGPHGAMGNPTLANGEPNPYYAPAVEAGSWTFSPVGGTYAALLQPKSNEQSFAQAMSALGLTNGEVQSIRDELAADGQASGFGNSNPTDAAWITRNVELQAGVTYTMSWNYVGTDYVPFNDGSITSLVAVEVDGNPEIVVNNSEKSFALLGFTNPGTGDYSTNSYGSTGWQISTYEVSETGTYKLGFASFNLGDFALSPALMIDDEIGSTQRCIPAGQNCEDFGGVASNNPTAPTVVPNTSSTSSTSSSTSSTTEPSEITVPPTSPPSIQPSNPPSATTTTTTTTTLPPVVETTVPETPTTISGESNAKPSKPNTKPSNESEVTPTQNTDTSNGDTETPTDAGTSGGIKQDNGEIPQESTNQIPQPTNEAKEKEEELNKLSSLDIKELSEEEISKVVALVASILASDIDTEVAQQLASSSVVLASIDTKSASQIFASIDVSSLSEESAQQIVSAVQQAPEEIRQTFESVINIFSGSFDKYVPLGSTIDVSTRRTVIAVAALTQVTVGAAFAASSSGKIGGQTSVSSERYARKPEEEEEAGEVESPDLRYWLDTISIWVYVNGIRKLSMKKFLTKFWYETLALGFTLSSSIILWVTLSGSTRTIAIIATLLAFAAHFYLVMWKQQNEEDK